MRRIAFDLETTGLAANEGHRIIEIGAVEIVNRQLTGNEFHSFLNPEREVDEGAQAVHGYSLQDLEHHPRFFEIADRLLEFLSGSQLVIHNAPFDMGFLLAELDRMAEQEGRDLRSRRSEWTVLDTLAMARKKHPGNNSLDALIRRYQIAGPDRQLHGALKDARLLADVYLAMTSGQEKLEFQSGEAAADESPDRTGIRRALPSDRPKTPLMEISEDEIRADETIAERLQLPRTEQ